MKRTIDSYSIDPSLILGRATILKGSKMDTKIKKKWLKALRSGRYEQGQGQLKTPSDKFCCLGVLCDILDPDYWDSADYFVADGVLPEKFLEKADFNDGEPYEEHYTRDPEATQDQLITLNDVDQKSFKEIADWIEKHL